MLFSFRVFRKLEPEDVAKELAVSLDEYKDLEFGLDNIDAEMAIQLSALYQAPPQFFLANNSTAHLSVIYSQCHFENSNGYVNHLYQNDQILSVKDEEIQLLKEQIKQLQRQNEKLIQSLLSQKIET